MGIEEENEILRDSVDELKTKLDVLGGHLRHAEKEIERQREELTRHKIVVQSKLTRRQQKMWVTWVSSVDLGKELKLKSHFTFPKIGMKFLSGKRKFDAVGNPDDSDLRYALTGLKEKDSTTGFLHEEAADLAEYLNSFPENQHQLKNMDSEFRDAEQEERMREELKK